MRKIDVCLSPDMIHLYEVPDHSVVVVDILRATSCMVTAFAHGVQSIAPFAKLEDCLAMKSKGYLAAGERDGKKVDGFDFGNSPFEYQDSKLSGKHIAFTTTNGTQAIAKSLGAKEILIGSFLNLSTIVKHLRECPFDILVVCAGWKGKVNMEDTLFAGALVEHLRSEVAPACDSPQAAQHLYNIARNNMVDFLSTSSHVKRLEKLNVSKDVQFCLTPDQYDVLPWLQNNELVRK